MAASTVTPDQQNPPAGPLKIQQGPLLPMPVEKPVQTDTTGYVNTPDGLETTGLGDIAAESPRSEPAPIPNHSRVVAYPSGHTVAFPDSLTAQEFAGAARRSWDFLNQEAVGAAQMITGLPSAIADSVSVAPTADEMKNLGVPANPTLAQKAALALYRNLGEPIQNAAQWYGTLVRHHQNIIDAIPQDVLAQGIGAGAGAAVLGKVLGEGTEPAREVAVKPTVRSAKATTNSNSVPTPEVEVLGAQNTSEAPLGTKGASEITRNQKALTSRELSDAAAQYLRSQIKPGEAKTTVEPIEHAEEAPATDEDVNAFLRTHFGDNAPRVHIESAEPGETSASRATSAEENSLAEKAVQGAKAKIEYSKDASGELRNIHRVDVSSPKDGPNGYITATEEKDEPGIWRVDKSQIDPAGTGAGLRAYAELAKQAKQQGAELQSGSVVSDAAQRVWEKLKSQGFDVHEVESVGGKTFRIPAPREKPPQFDLTDDWKHAAQKALAGEGRSVGAASINDLETKPDVPTFFSKAAQVATDKLPASASGDQILATLKNNGVKQSEMDWLGLPEYLQGKAKMSKADVQQFIDEHKIQLEETTLGGREHIDSALADLRKQRDQAMAVNNRTYADDLRYHSDTPSLFNAMKDGEDVDGIIAKMPSNLQESARKFVDSENQIHAIDKQITDLENQVANKPARFGQYTLPGEKSNYKELLLRLPEQDNISALNDQLAEADAERTHYLQTLRPVPGDVELRFQDAQKAVRQAENKSTAFKSSHFDEPDILAHVRFDDRTMPDGKKALFLEEVQSDWAQKGKREGFANPAPTKLPDGIYVTPDDDQFQVVNREGNPLLRQRFASESEARTAALHHYGEGAGNPGVPDMPFKETYHELALKRMLRYAAENGYDHLSWATGDQQAERYDLSKQIDSLDWLKHENGTYSIAATKDGDELLRKDNLNDADVDALVGKDVGQKIRAGQGKNYSMQGTHDIGTLKGLDLKLGGEALRKFYDVVIPRFLGNYAKKWGAKVGQSEISTTNPGTLRYEIVDPKGQVQDAFRNRQGAEDAVRGYQESHRGSGKWTIHDNGTTEKIWTMPITPEMKKSVLKVGQPIARTEQPSWQDIAAHALSTQEAA